MNASLFIVTHAKHLAFFRLCAKSIAHHVRGFREVVVVVPTADRDAFLSVAFNSTADGIPFTFRDRYEAPERGHVWMNATKCCADLYCPEADMIAHIDADSVFTRDIRPADYMWHGCIGIVAIPYEQAGDALAWKPLVDRALGVDAKLETMQRPELAYWSRTYREMRAHIEHLHRQPFFEYALTHHVAEFPTLGTMALQIGRVSQYTVVKPRSSDDVRFIKQGWSHYVDDPNPNVLREQLAAMEAAIG